MNSNSILPFELPADFKHWTHFSPSWNALHPEPGKNYGIRSAKIHFILLGPKGAIELELTSAWAVESVQRHLAKFPFGENFREPAMAWLTIHGREPLYEGHDLVMENCQLLNGKCYCDGSGVSAQALSKGLIARGSNWVWEKLFAIYQSTFADGEWPDSAVEEMTREEILGGKGQGKAQA